MSSMAAIRSKIEEVFTSLSTVERASFDPAALTKSRGKGVLLECMFGQGGGDHSKSAQVDVTKPLILWVEGRNMAAVDAAQDQLRAMFNTCGIGSPYAELASVGLISASYVDDLPPLPTGQGKQHTGISEFRMKFRF